MKKTLRKSDIRGLNENIKEYGLEFNKKDKIEDFNNLIILVNNKPYFLIINNKYLPTLKLLLEKPDILKKVIVDMGAIKFVTSGADIMRPGIVYIDERINKDEYIIIIDENNKKPLSIGKTMYDYNEMKNMDSGKVIKNIHYVGDKIWNEY